MGLLDKLKDLFMDEVTDDEEIELEEENKKLNIKVASLEWEIKWLNYTIDKLKEENQTLEIWLDRKEKVNKSLREENRKLKDELQEWLNAVWNK